MMAKHNKKTGCNSDITLLKFPTLLIKIRNCNAKLPYIINDIIIAFILFFNPNIMSKTDVIDPNNQLIVINITLRFVIDEPEAKCLDHPLTKLDNPSGYILKLTIFAPSYISTG